MFGGRFFEPNLRSVSKFGVDFVMDSFFGDIDAKFGVKKELAVKISAPGWLRSLGLFRKRPAPAPPVATDGQDIVCEEQLLEAFGKQP